MKTKDLAVLCFFIGYLIQIVFYAFEIIDGFVLICSILFAGFSLIIIVLGDDDK